MAQPRGWFFFTVFCGALAACGDPKNPLVDAGPDGNIPSPLATEPPEPLDASSPSDGGVIGIPADSSGRLIIPDSGAPPPEPMRLDGPLVAEAPGSKDLVGVSLDGVFRWRDVPSPLKAPEVSGEGLKEAAKLTVLGLKVSLTDTGRMRIIFESRALPLPGRTELRGRSDRYGHLLLWPNATDYRVIPAGALRTLLGERRVDVTPLATSKWKTEGEGRRLGLSVRKVEVSAPLGSVRLEIGKVTEAGEGGPLLCRAFVELLGVDPKSPVCQPGEVPLLAAWSWQEGGGILWEATAMQRRTDLAPSDFLVPPPSAQLAPSGLPIAPGGVLLSRDEVAAFRTSALTNLPPSTDPAVPGEGFMAVNQTDTLLYVLVDGIPVAIVPPLAETYVIGPPRGRYVVQWRTFLGERVIAPVITEMPARILSGGGLDAGAPDAGK